MPNWTTNQNNAITARKRNILVSAAAGSGKTAVLVERVIRLITDKDNPVDIDKLLIVTFTNAAASEMKSRISKSLKKILQTEPDNIIVRKQLSLLPMAKVCTIDSFCINLVRENFFELGISQDFTTFDEGELGLLEEQVINDTFDDCFNDNNDKAFISLIESFTTPNSDKALISTVKKLLRFIYAQPFPYKWLEDMIELYNPDIPFEESAWYDYCKGEISYLLSFAKELAQSSLDALYRDENKEQALKVIDTVSSDIALINSIEDKLNNDWDSLVDFGVIKLATLARTTKLDPIIASRVKSNRNIYKSIITSDIPALTISTSEDYHNDMLDLYPLLRKLYELIKEIDNRLMLEKRERNSYSFSDIEHFAIELMFKLNDTDVKKTELGEKLTEQYYEILVDEYQDTNEAQDMLFSYLSNGNNLFTVGDVKQSIYRFRLAMPHIFNNRRNEYNYYDENDNFKSSKIILDKNFRSRQGICSYVNFIFSKLMSERVGELTYNQDEYLNNGADFNDTNIPSAQMFILDGVKGELTAKKEATLIAKEIQRKIKAKEQIKDGEIYRDIRYGDFAIFMRSLKAHISEYAEVLTQFGIPVICDNSTNLFDNSEIKLIINLLRAIDNPTVDIPLLSTMLSPIYSFTADELAEIRIEHKQKSFYFSVLNSENEKAINFLSDLKELRRLSVTMSVSSFIRYLIDSKSIVALSNALGNGEQRYQNILKLISFAEGFDKGSNVGMTSFLRYIDKIISSDNTVNSAPLTVSQDNAVKLMSIHHSKGLEFPVCILAGASRAYNKSDLSDKMLLNTNMGLGIKCHNEDKLFQYQSLPYAVIKNKNNLELMSENLRVLYVALTRAKEQFITFSYYENLKSRLEKLSSSITDKKISPYTVQKINCDSDLLLLIALLHPDSKKLRSIANYHILPDESDFKMNIKIIDDFDLEDINEKLEFVPPEKSIVEQIREKLSFEYERSELSSISAKLTASSLDDIESSFDYLTSSKPAFLSSGELTSAERGTAMHTFMQYCDYSNSREDIESEINILTDNSFITKEQADVLDRKMLSDFFSSSIAQRMFNSDKLYREFKVSSFVKASDIYDTDFDDKVLVQGIADCVFEENGELVIVDYKTDRVDDETALLERYKKQIAFYSSAVSKALKKPVKESMLYSFTLSKVCLY